MAKSISPADPSSEPQISPIHSFFSGTSRRILTRRPNRFRRRPYWGRPITFFPSDLRPQGREAHPRPSKSRGRGQKSRSRTRPLYGGTQSTAGTKKFPLGKCLFAPTANHTKMFHFYVTFPRRRHFPALPTTSRLARIRKTSANLPDLGKLAQSSRTCPRSRPWPRGARSRSGRTRVRAAARNAQLLAEV
jgi:hypothetical protein